MDWLSVLLVASAVVVMLCQLAMICMAAWALWSN